MHSEKYKTLAKIGIKGLTIFNFGSYVLWPVVAHFCVIWSLVESGLIGNHSTSSYFQKICINFQEIPKTKMTSQQETLINSPY